MIVVVPGGQSEQLRGAPPPVLTLALARLAVVPGPGRAKTFMAGIHLSLAVSFLHSVSENFLTTLIQTSQVFSCAATQHVIMYFFLVCVCLSHPSCFVPSGPHTNSQVHTQTRPN